MSRTKRSRSPLWASWTWAPAVNLELRFVRAIDWAASSYRGNVDGIAHVAGTSRDGDSLRVKVAVPAELARYIARKGSVTLDGVSLTVNEVEGDTFGINLIPHTQLVTTLGRLQPGARLNPRSGSDGPLCRAAAGPRRLNEAC